MLDVIVQMWMLVENTTYDFYLCVKYNNPIIILTTNLNVQQGFTLT